MSYLLVNVEESVVRECKCRRLSPRTTKTYLYCIHRFLKWSKKELRYISKKDVRLFLAHLGIKTNALEEHKKTYQKFKEIVRSENLNIQLAEIYEEESKKAETLLKIFFDEKKKRGRFTYNISANANKPFAEDSLKNAKLFASAIKNLIEIKNDI